MSNLRASNPFTEVHKALWARLLQRPGIEQRVRPRNRIDFSAGEGDPRKRNPQTADLPELAILPAGCQLDRLSNDSRRIHLRFAVVVRTGRTNVEAVLLPLQWDFLCAFEDADHDNLGVEGVIQVEPAPANFALTEGGSGTPEMQWSTIGEVRVVLVMSRASMRGEV